jgi:hypothetical protein
MTHKEAASPPLTLNKALPRSGRGTRRAKGTGPAPPAKA